ncbi:SCO family protein [Caldimonas tepidiphila]|uniref:SCO family protein n=1 Tax=Caldimonas tepidiphila TaxID=2315841 RepID=UPI000E5C479F|nr:SCO family protein [Caldimonas tepidiphila]
MQGTGRRNALRCAWAGMLGIATHAVRAHPGHDRAPPSAAGADPTAATPTPAQVRLPEARLLDQDGRTLELRRDVIGGHIVLVDFVYTSCTTVCPVLSALLGALQERLGPDVRLVSITVDPLRDTPARLKAHAATHRAGPAWTWLTGAPGTIDAVLRGFGAAASEPARHPAMVLVGDGRSGRWTRFTGLPDPQRLLAQVEELRRGRTALAGTAGSAS